MAYSGFYKMLMQEPIGKLIYANETVFLKYSGSKISK